MKRFKPSFAVFAALALAACVPQQSEQPSEPVAEEAQHIDTQADEAAIRAAIEEWSAAAHAKDIDRFVSVYADDAMVMLEGAPDPRGIEAIREGIGGMMQDPNFTLWFEPDNVVVSRSGDLAYETGTYSLTVSDPQGIPVSQGGYYVVVWKKQDDGVWKVVVDSPVSDPPAAPEGE
jgi:uncharacterized protein (TIGR02246 family)